MTELIRRQVTMPAPWLIALAGVEGLVAEYEDARRAPAGEADANREIAAALRACSRVETRDDGPNYRVPTGDTTVAELEALEARNRAIDNARTARERKADALLRDIAAACDALDERTVRRYLTKHHAAVTAAWDTLRDGLPALREANRYVRRFEPVDPSAPMSVYNAAPAEWDEAVRAIDALIAGASTRVSAR